MKKSELRQIIKEEIKRVLKEEKITMIKFEDDNDGKDYYVEASNLDSNNPGEYRFTLVDTNHPNLTDLKGKQAFASHLYNEPGRPFKFGNGSKYLVNATLISM